MAAETAGAAGETPAFPGERLVPIVTATATLLPRRLPRGEQAPAALRLGFTSRAANPPGVPQLGAISFELARNLSLHAEEIGMCPIKRLYRPPEAARRSCPGSVVGSGTVDSELLLEGEEVAVEGTMTAFYDLDEGQPRILGQVRAFHDSTELIYVLPFRIERERGRFATKLTIPRMRFVLGKVIRGAYAYTFPNGYGRISRLSLSLKRPGFVRASCPARKGKGGIDFPLMRATLDYSEPGPGQRPDTTTSEKRGSVVANCRVSG